MRHSAKMVTICRRAGGDDERIASYISHLAQRRRSQRDGAARQMMMIGNIDKGAMRLSQQLHIEPPPQR